MMQRTRSGPLTTSRASYSCSSLSASRAEYSNIWGSPTEDDPKPFNQCSYSNSSVDDLIKKGLRTSDPKVERKCWLELQKIIYEDQPYTFLFWRSESFACDKRFRGIAPNILTTYFKMETWWVPKAKHKF